MYAARVSSLLNADQRLVELTGRARAALAVLQPGDQARERAFSMGEMNAAHRSIAVHSLGLDGSTITMELAEHFDAEQPVSADSTGPIRAKAVIGEPSDPLHIPRLEYQGMRDALNAIPMLVDGWKSDPLGAMKVIHRMVTNGLAEDQHAGRWRDHDQVMSDRQTGQAIFAPAPFDQIETLMSDLGMWLVTNAWRYDPLVVAGVVHWRILTVMPFVSANGRVARLCAHLVLVAHEGDTGRILDPDRYWALQPMDYYREVGASLRRPGLAQWLSWQVWAVALSAEDRLRVRSSCFRQRDRLSQQVATYVSGQEIFSVKDFATACNLSLSEATCQLAIARAAGLVFDMPDGMYWSAIRT